MSARDPGFPEHGHDHGACVRDALGEARARCAESGVRLTALRARVLEILWQSHRPLGAYAILEVLAGDGRRGAPPTVYRALEFLCEQGLAHRIASLNAFVGCAAPGHATPGEFLICASCGAVAEVTDAAVDRAIRRSARAHGFQAARHTLEISGRCPNCVSGGEPRILGWTG